MKPSQTFQKNENERNIFRLIVRGLYYVNVKTRKRHDKETVKRHLSLCIWTQTQNFSIISKQMQQCIRIIHHDQVQFNPGI